LSPRTHQPVRPGFDTTKIRCLEFNTAYGYHQRTSQAATLDAVLDLRLERVKGSRRVSRLADKRTYTAPLSSGRSTMVHFPASASRTHVYPVRFTWASVTTSRASQGSLDHQAAPLRFEISRANEQRLRDFPPRAHTCTPDLKTEKEQNHHKNTYTEHVERTRESQFQVIHTQPANGRTSSRHLLCIFCILIFLHAFAFLVHFP